MKSLKGKIAVVTGGGGDGIGNALCKELANRGARVAFCDIAKLDVTEKQLSQLNADYYSEQVDIGNKEAINRFVDNVLKKFGAIDVLINNAGIALGDLAFEEASEADLEKITNINYWGVIHTTQRCYPHMLKRPEAAVANISSSQGILALPYLVPYCATKFAVRGFTDALRAEHVARGLGHMTFHTVHPGAVATNITLNADYHGSGTQKFHEQLQNGTPPQEAARIIVDGIQKKRARIFISDGRIQDVVARVMPTLYLKLIKPIMKLKKVDAR